MESQSLNSPLCCAWADIISVRRKDSLSRCALALGSLLLINLIGVMLAPSLPLFLGRGFPRN